MSPPPNASAGASPRASPTPSPTSAPAASATADASATAAVRTATTGAPDTKVPIVYSLSKRDILRSRKTLFALIVSLVPVALALLAVLSAQVNPADPDYFPILAEGLAFTGLVVAIPLVCLILAGGSIADEAEERTLSYLLVRPIRRRHLFLGRTLAVAWIAVALTVLQVVAVWLVDGLFLLTAQTNPIRVGQGETMGATAAWLLSLPAGLVAGGLAAVLYTGMFCAVSILFTRYHFFANLVWFLVWELGFGLSHLPPAWLSANHSLRIVAHLIDPAVPALSASEGLGQWMAVPLVLAFVAFWWWLGVRIIERRDFHITSAAT